MDKLFPFLTMELLGLAQIETEIDNRSAAS
jgi:hypothetical protein